MACKCPSRASAAPIGPPPGIDPDEWDPFCDPNNPVIVTYDKVEAAYGRIKDKIIHTPCTKSHFSDITGINIYYKCELFQYTGSFKDRGALNTLLQMPEDKKKVIAASAGNHGQSMSYHGTNNGFGVRVCMPILAPMMKQEKCKRYGAEIIIDGNSLTDAKRNGIRIGREEGYTYINGYDHPEVLAGQGTCGMEILEDLNSVELAAIVIPCGGGSLVAGVAVAVKNSSPNTKIIGVEAENCPAWSESFKNKQHTKVKSKPSLADGLAVESIGFNSWETCKDLLDNVIVVNEEYISIAMMRLIEMERMIVEGAGAVGVAAILSGQLDEFKGKNIVIILTGGNIDTNMLRRAIDRGLSAEGRLIQFKLYLKDQPGCVTDFCKQIESMGVVIKHLIHERAWITDDVTKVSIKLICETRDANHSQELYKLVSENYDAIFKNFPREFVPFPQF